MYYTEYRKSNFYGIFCVFVTCGLSLLMGLTYIKIRPDDINPLYILILTVVMGIYHSIVPIVATCYCNNYDENKSQKIYPNVEHVTNVEVIVK